MNNVTKFLKSTELDGLEIFAQLKCTHEEARILQFMLKQYVSGAETLSVIEVLGESYNIAELGHLDKISLIKNLLELGWIVQNNFNHIKISEISKLELINTNVTLSTAFLKLIEEGNLELALPEIKEYSDHLEYLQDQFFRIDLAHKLKIIKHNFDENSPNINRLKSKLNMLEVRIKERVGATEHEIMLEGFFKEHELSEKEQMIFLALLKEEYGGSDESIRDMNSLIDLISNDDYEKIKHRSLLGS